MADKDKNPNTEKALGQDPFEGLFGTGWDEADNETTTTESTTETDQTTELSDATDEAEAALESEAEIETEINHAFELLVPIEEAEVETEPAVDEGAQATEPSEATGESEPELETETQIETETDHAFEALAVSEEPDEVELAPSAEVEDGDELEPEFKAIAGIEATEIDQALEALTITIEPKAETVPVAEVENDDHQTTVPPDTTNEAEPALEIESEIETVVDQATELLETAEEPDVETVPVPKMEDGDHQTTVPSKTTEESVAEFESTAEVETEIDHALEAMAEEAEAETTPVAAVEDGANQTTELSEIADEAEVETAPLTEVESGDEPESELETITESHSTEDQTTELSEAEEASNVLNEIIASIDAEIEQSHESDLMAAIQTEASGSLSETLEQYIIFSLAGAIYAAPAANVREVGEMANLTPVPNVPNWLLGVTNLRGDVLSVVDLHIFLSLEQPDYIESLSRGDATFSGEREVLVVHPREDASLMTTGLVVDEVNDIRYLATDRITAPTAPIEDQVGSYLRGVYEEEDHFLVVLDFERLLFSPEMQQFETI